MQWYHAQGDRREGPVEDEEFRRLVDQGVIRDYTLVWNPTMPDWKPWSEVRPAAVPAPVAAGGQVCAECGRSFSREDMIPFGDRWVCADCKPRFVEMLKQGVAPAMERRYGGFWVRLVAKIMDGLILSLFNMAVGFIAGVSGFMRPTTSEEVFTPAFVVVNLLAFLVPVVYYTWFVGRFGATPGKMAVRLKVVVADGSRVTYWRALGRHFSEYLSAIILGIGYLMAAWDPEKRALHDRICDTRVIRQ